MNETIDVEGLHVSYYGKEVIKNVSFSIETGKLIGVIGPNGAGKSTMLKAVLGLIARDSGKVTIEKKNVNAVRKKIAYVPQRSNIDWDFPIIVRDAVLLGTYPKLGLFHRPGKKEKEWAMACLAQVGMADYWKNQIGELSGGQQQRVFIARALAQEATYFFLDEPFVGIDVASEEVIINILKGLRDKGKTVFVVHHDLSKVESYFEDLVLLNKELISYGAVQDVFTPKMIQKAYDSVFSFMGNLGVEV